ncbi:hypothetical protein PFICI_13163 [Pestalotiopsis fici W106-1]|uniref:DUF221-domain-containing protein n=1 Tax=Pestalotiopsis fici (strain W106-1 / CGMCC3.15140) TaxID=1229662 RepID=W3WLN1_PESFW|nr:uncharacterized protein PFICI_13163 [Pestalotiopsis fici W106-1]ETS74679.1 hypothetical protein PFICI_13163 [Pestalotiopsis fici W106-1]
MEVQVVLSPDMASNAHSAAIFETTNNDDASNDTPPTSLPAVLAAFVPSLIVAIFYIALFMILRKPFRRIYSPRTYIDLIPEKHRTPSSSTSRLDWISALLKLDDRFILEHSSLDGYLFLRFLRTIIFICFVGSCITWPILFPVNATGGGNLSQLEKIGFGNVADTSRLWAHVAVAWLVYIFVMYVVARERLWLIGLRQAWQLSKSNASRLSSRTVLYLDPPKEAPLHGDLTLNYGQEARKQWVVRSTDKLDHVVSSRDSKATKLESAQVSFLQKTTKKRSKLSKKQGHDVELSEETIDELRPTQKRFFITGEGRDKISHLREKLEQAAREVEEKREGFSTDESHGRFAVFVEYQSQSAAQRAYRAAPKSHLPASTNLAIDTKLIGVLPKEIIWSNLALPQAIRVSRKTIGNLTIAALIFFWSVISAFVGTVSNVNYLSNNVEWLHWLQDLPAPILGVLTGFVPPLITSLLSSYVPIFMRYVAKKSGEPTTVTAELQVQNWYFMFQIIQVFFVTALSSSATALIPAIISQPHQVPLLLAENLPKSSKFYLTYFILQGLGSSASNILNQSDLLKYYLLDWFWNTTPRQKYDQFTSLKSMSWGKLYPKFTNFVIIALAYACISPLVMGFASAGLSIFYLSYRHNLFFVVQPKLETKGRCYTRSLSQILTGVYVGELALIGLMGLRKATGPSILMAILFVGTAIYNHFSNRFLNPLEDHLPTKLIGEGEGEEDALLAAEEGEEVLEEAHDRSRIHHLGRDVRVPHRILDPIARFFEPQIYTSHRVMKRYLKDTDVDPPNYTKDDHENAYSHPNLTSKTPKIWLPSDKAKLSKKEIEANSQAGITTTDEGAWLDDKGRVKIERDDLRSLPLWKDTTLY